MIMSYLELVRPQCKVESFYRKKVMQLVLLAFVDTATLPLKLWDAIIFNIHVKKPVLLSARKKFGEAKKEGPRRTTKIIYRKIGL